MNFLKLTKETATTALRNLPDPVPAPSVALQASHTAEALCSSGQFLLVDATLNHLSSHLSSIAHFARTVEALDAQFAEVLHHG